MQYSTYLIVFRRDEAIENRDMEIDTENLFAWSNQGKEASADILQVFDNYHLVLPTELSSRDQGREIEPGELLGAAWLA